MQQSGHFFEPPERQSFLKLASFREIFGVDLRTLALFRVLLGSFIILDLILRSRDLVAHYTDFGIMPRDVLTGYLSSGSFSIHMMNGTAPFQVGLFILAGVFAFLMIIGWRTRLVTFVSWFLLLSLQNRNTVIQSGEETLVMVLMFWAMFLPLGARYSVDAAMDKKSDSVPNAYFSIATLALLIQGMSMYFFGALLKWDPVWFPNGTAVHAALQLDYFVKPFALWFRQFETLLQGLTYYVWSLELLGPVLMFSPVLHRPLRVIIMCAYITMHIGFFMCLEIGAFPVISIIMNLTFLPGWVWDWLEQKLKSETRQRLHIWYDRDCGFCLKMCRLFRTFLFLGSVPIQPAQDDAKIGKLLVASNSWVVSDGTEHHLKWRAMNTLLSASPVFWPVGALLSAGPVHKVGNWLYDGVADNRETFAQVTSAILPWRPISVSQSWPGSIFALLCLSLITVQNVSTLAPTGVNLSQQFRTVRQFLGLYQNWALFAPYPEVTSPWPIIEGELQDGTKVDVYNRQTGKPSFAKPARVAATYANYRWRKYLSNLEDQSYRTGPQPLASNYARYLCRLWHTDVPYKQRLKTFKIYFNVERTPPPGEPKVVKTRLVWTHDCFG